MGPLSVQRLLLHRRLLLDKSLSFAIRPWGVRPSSFGCQPQGLTGLLPGAGTVRGAVI